MGAMNAAVYKYITEIATFSISPVQALAGCIGAIGGFILPMAIFGPLSTVGTALAS